MTSYTSFSLVLPEGGRVAVRRPGVTAAVSEAHRVNTSRAARGLALVGLLCRPTGIVYDVPPDADVLTLSASIEREVGG